VDDYNIKKYKVVYKVFPKKQGDIYYAVEIKTNAGKRNNFFFTCPRTGEAVQLHAD
jgi:hypothetical protein